MSMMRGQAPLLAAALGLACSSPRGLILLTVNGVPAGATSVVVTADGPQKRELNPVDPASQTTVKIGFHIAEGSYVVSAFARDTDRCDVASAMQSAVKSESGGKVDVTLQLTAVTPRRCPTDGGAITRDAMPGADATTADSAPADRAAVDGADAGTDARPDLAPDTAPPVDMTPDTPAPTCPTGMVFIPAGAFSIGPGRPAPLPAFCIDVTHVTAGEYAACTTCSPAGTGMFCNGGIAFRATDPANCLSFEEARFYCQSRGKILPSEEQWEWAARGGAMGNLYPWGAAVPTATDSPERLCWIARRDGMTGWPNRPAGTCPAGSYPAGNSPSGLKDMSGNVWHWTTSTLTSGTTVGQVVRGGGWDNSDATRMTTSYRNGPIPPATRHYGLGFRCVRAPL